MSGEYSVIFTGKVLDGLDLNLVKNNLADKLKMSADQVTKLFESAPMLIKKYDSNEDAESLIAVFKSCGAVCTVEIAVPDWELVVDDADKDNKPKTKNRGLLRWFAVSTLAAATFLAVYFYFL